ncbi:MAG: transporter substrate-binding domain-containing protein [Propionibacteriales bacterium]|nr:transporter substrate-binding domain-containing protein [Propionibacteriales bacterium]
MVPLSRTQRRFVGVAAAAALLLAASGCGEDEGGDGTATAEGGISLVEEDHLTICTHLPYQPFQHRDKTTGDIVGFDVELLDLLAEDLGVQRENGDIVNIAWEQITSGAVFTADRCDVGMGAMTITDERATALTISDPYFEATQGMLVRTEEPYSSLEELEGERVGVQSDTTGEIYAEDNAEEHGYEIVKYDDLALELNALKAGNIAAAINDNSPLEEFVADNPDTEVSALFETGEVYGFPAKKDDENAQMLIERMNALLAEAFDDGTYAEIYQKWFDEEPPFELPPG